MNLDNMPQELKAINNWVLVQLKPKANGGFDKVPVRLNQGVAVDSAWSKPSNRSSFEAVKALLDNELLLIPSERRFHGVGFVLNDTDTCALTLIKRLLVTL